MYSHYISVVETSACFVGYSTCVHLPHSTCCCPGNVCWFCVCQPFSYSCGMVFQFIPCKHMVHLICVWVAPWYAVVRIYCVLANYRNMYTRCFYQFETCYVAYCNVLHDDLHLLIPDIRTLRNLIFESEQWKIHCFPLSLLVGGLEHEFYFSIYWECHHPNWRSHIFQRGWLKPATRLYILCNSWLIL